MASQPAVRDIFTFSSKKGLGKRFQSFFLFLKRYFGSKCNHFYRLDISGNRNGQDPQKKDSDSTVVDPTDHGSSNYKKDLNRGLQMRVRDPRILVEIRLKIKSALN